MHLHEFDGLQVPPRGELQQPGSIYRLWRGEHHYYQYKGYRVCLSYPRSGCICILVTVQPMPEFIQDIIDSQP